MRLGVGLRPITSAMNKESLPMSEVYSGSDSDCILGASVMFGAFLFWLATVLAALVL